MWMKKENELVEEILEGNQEFFEVLLRPYRKGFLNMVCRMTGDLEEAKEICQEALIRIYRHLHTFNTEKSFKSWVYRIVVNSTYDFLREKKKHQGLIKRQRHATTRINHGPEKRYLDKEIKQKIEGILRALSPKEKMIFLLRDEEGMTVRETAGILGCSASSVRTHLSRARRKIRDRFKEGYGPREVIG